MGDKVETPMGEGEVVDIDLFREIVKVKLKGDAIVSFQAGEVRR